MPYLLPQPIQNKVRIRAVYVRPYNGKFSFAVTWEGEDGLKPDAEQCEMTYAPEAGLSEGANNAAMVYGIRLELEQSGPKRAKELGVTISEYYAALDAWDGNVTILGSHPAR